MTFAFYPARFEFTAIDTIFFPPHKPGNILRGAFGDIFRRIACVPECPGVSKCELRHQCAYAGIFEPGARGKGPSGFAEWPRPFVFRARHLDGCSIAPGEMFHFDVNIFDMRDPALSYFTLTFAQLAREGLGPRRGRAQLDSVQVLDSSGRAVPDGSVDPSYVEVDLCAGAPVEHVEVRFLAPTELKSGHGLAPHPDFRVLFGRARDRVSTLRALYGAGPLEIDFKAMGGRAAAVSMTRCDIRRMEVERRSSRTGQTHSIGGFVGVAEYSGDLAEFVPYLLAAQWTGVGRQTVWGNGEIAVRCR